MNKPSYAGRDTAMKIDLKKLEEFADKATRGPWRVSRVPHKVIGDGAHILASYATAVSGLREANAAYISSLDPSTVKAMIEVIKVAKGVARFDQYSLSNANHIAVHAQAILALRASLAQFDE